MFEFQHNSLPYLNTKNVHITAIVRHLKHAFLRALVNSYTACRQHSPALQSVCFCRVQNCPPPSADMIESLLWRACSTESEVFSGKPHIKRPSKGDFNWISTHYFYLSIIISHFSIYSLVVQKKFPLWIVRVHPRRVDQ